MQFTIISIVIPLALYAALPLLLRSSRYRVLLAAACLVYAVSWYLPPPDIFGRQTAFMTHFFGGGVFCGLLGLYIQLVKKWRPKWYVELGALFAMVSSLGVLNELFEVWLWVIGLMPQGIADTSWDLVANTTGALVFYLSYKVWRWLRSA